MNPSKARHDWRTVAFLSAIQAFSQSGQTMLVTVTALTGAYLSENASFSTLPFALQFCGTMAATVPASLLMARFGRRMGLTVGQFIGGGSGLVAAWSILNGDFWLFAVSCLGIGVHNSFWQYIRFAATEVVGKEHRGKAVSCIMMGGIGAALLGPWLALHSREMLAPFMFAGCYLVLAGLNGVNALLLQITRFEPSLASESNNEARRLVTIARQRTFFTAVLASATGYGIMVLVMAATPLSMADCGFTFSDTARIIQWHVLGMYLPSFFSGRLIDRFGAERIIGVGVALNLLAASINLWGSTFDNFWLGLAFIGVGWNFMFVGGTTMLTHTYRPAERAKVQALNDFLVFGVVSSASFLSGTLFASHGWIAINAVTAAPLLLVLGSFAYFYRYRVNANLHVHSN